tara:strand:- start:21590 stop:28336 length:6747 start_codon:yes stop_codon:yes gene_type:complete
MRAVDRKLTFWMAGYYDDFIGARALPDDLNIQGDDWVSSKTHHGNPLNGWANLSPRYTYAWCERGDGVGGRFNNFSIPAANQYKHNGGISEWLSYDENRRNSGNKYQGMAHLEYPDSLTNANRQRFDGGTGILGEAYAASDAIEAYLLFSYGYNTENRYYSAIGTNDSSFGRATMHTPDYDGGATNSLDVLAGIPTGVFAPVTTVRTHIAGVYAGEVLYNDAYTSSVPKAYLYPIESPAGKPFLVSEVRTSSSTYTPILSFDGSLNSKGTGDVFAIRIHACAVDVSSARFKLSIGCEGAAFTSGASGDTGYSNAAIELEITPVAYQERDPSLSYSPPTVSSLWDDYEFVINYDTYTYTLYKNGTAVVTDQAMNAKTDTTNFSPTEMFGWMIEAKDCSKKAAVLIDRVGLVRPLNDHPSGIEMPPATSMDYSTTVNSVSTLNVQLVDDDSQLNLLAFFNASSYADWSLLMFRDNVDRPLWRGSVNSMDYSLDSTGRTPTIKLSAQDYFSSLDQQIPTWELGNSGDADSTEVVAYNRSEAQNNLNTYYFGASRLVSANAGLGFNEKDDGAGVFLSHTDSRMRNRSAHPIQMYGDEDAQIGPNTPYADWDAACVANPSIASAQYRALHSRWMQDFKNSLWFKHMFSRIKNNAISTTLASSFAVGDTQIDLTDYCGPLVNGGSIEIIDANGIVDSGVVESASHSDTISIEAVDWIAYGGNASIPYTLPSGQVSQLLFHIPYYWFPVVSLAKSSANWNRIVGKVVTIAGNSNSNLNGDWKVAPCYANRGNPANFKSEATRNGVLCTQYILQRVDTAPIAQETNIFLWTGSNISQSIRIGTKFTTNPTPFDGDGYGIPQATRKLKVTSNGQIWYTEPTSGNILCGGTTAVAPATNFFQRAHPIGSLVKIREHVDDYKHVWVMWADMRNDGSADADGGFRKKNFGLMAPYAGNYQVSMVWSDSTTSNDSERQEFIDLSIGKDIDLWEMDATRDPLTGNTWSSVDSDTFTPTSFTGSDDLRYQQWQDKAGAFLFIDASKFFNLNTESNGGVTGQSSGGRKEIGDYLVETEGFPVLIDNYWERAPTGPLNIISSTAWNSNFKYFNSEVTTLVKGIVDGDEIIQLTKDIVWFDGAETTVGQIISNEAESIWHFDTESALDSVETGIIIAPTGVAGTLRITRNPLITTTDLLYCRAGNKISISNSTTTPSTDGNYVVVADNGMHGATNWELLIEVNPDTSYFSGTGDVTMSNDDIGYSYKINTVKSLGQKVPSSPATNQWDGTAYGGANSAETLTRLGVSGHEGEAFGSIPIGEDDTSKDAQVYVGLANVFPMRLMMQVDGFIENKNSRTYFEQDKFRVTWLDSLTQNWLTQSALYGMPSIASIPRTNNMTTSQLSSADGPLGGIIGVSGSTYAGRVQVNSYGPADLVNGDVVEIINNSELSLASDNYRTRYTVSQVGFGGPNVFWVAFDGAVGTTDAGYWRKIGVVDDFGSLNDCRNTTIANIFSSTQSGSGVGDIDGTRSVMSWLMGRDSQPSFRPTYGNGFVFNENNLKVSNLKTESGGQISNVRLFYAGGTSFVDYPSATLGTRPRWDIIHVESITSKNEALIVAKQEYEKNKMAPFSVDAEIIRFGDGHTMNGLNDTMLYNARYGYVADQSRTIPRTSTLAGVYTENKAWAWTSLWGGNLFTGIQNALDGRDGAATSNTDTQTILNYDDNYYWYGANSVSNAVQIVHIPQGMPKTTQKTAGITKINADGHLRIVIDIDDRLDEFLNPDDAMFRVYLVDYDWAGSVLGADPVERSKTSISVASNGFYQIAVPTTYWADQVGDETVVISVNYDYLIALLQERCGSTNIHLNGNNWSGTTYTTLNTNSIFPLGARKFGQADYWNKHAEWYAPRLHIVDDWNFVAATTLKYTDTQMGLVDENLSIRSIGWNIDGRSSESLSIGLERDVSRAAKTFASYILPKVPRGGVQTSGQGNQGGNGASTDGGDSTDSGRGGDNDGYPTSGGWQDWAGWGDAGPATTSSADLSRNTNPNRTTRPDGLNTGIGGVKSLSSSALGNAALNRIKGSMNFNNDSVTGGAFGVLGQTKPAPVPRDQAGVSGIDSFIAPASGDAFMGENGMVFSGSVGDTFAAPPTAFVATARIPPNSLSNKLEVTGRVSMRAATGTAVLFVTVECTDTGVRKTNTVSIDNIVRGQVVLFSGVLEGADVSSNTIKVTVERNAQTGDDDANFASVTLHNLQIATDNRSVSGNSQSSSFSYSN